PCRLARGRAGDLMAPRYAVYFAPPAGGALWRCGSAWLGRDAGTGRSPARPAVAGFAPGRLDELTAEPRRYGFHGTLKPPMALAPGRSEADLLTACAGFAASRTAFEAPPQRLAALGGFLALVPSAPSPELDALAADCVRAFDALRAPPAADELARRRASVLSERQHRYLREWGYPYVMEEFRFHMTLTGRLDAADREPLKAALERLAAPLATEPLPVDAIALFVQHERGAPFRILARFPFRG
ncbi:MAG TPA: DUF1045 domain-containing protein, partial [Arenibaculum sp.]|nr:DUF1045 domain-containing protein [Arenibaculum sp.]